MDSLKINFSHKTIECFQILNFQSVISIFLKLSHNRNIFRRNILKALFLKSAIILETRKITTALRIFII
jgi:hypothetical protein